MEREHSRVFEIPEAAVGGGFEGRELSGLSLVTDGETFIFINLLT